MGFEQQPNEELPAIQALRSPQETAHERNLVQCTLMDGYPEGEEAWVTRYAATFARLFDMPKQADEEEGFQELVIRAHRKKDRGALEQIKQRLEDEISRPH